MSSNKTTAAVTSTKSGQVIRIKLRTNNLQLADKIGCRVAEFALAVPYSAYHTLSRLTNEFEWVQGLVPLRELLH